MQSLLALKLHIIFWINMTEEEKQDLERAKEDIANLENQIGDIERKKEKEKNKGIEVPVHFHKQNKIEFKDLAGGFQTINATPTHVAEQGKVLIHKTNFVLYIKVGSNWKYVQLS